uniref:Uncharacterized protein n=2 Tax=Oryza TaxID=4527 RepID=A0A0D3EPQ0_9ORYZ
MVSFLSDCCWQCTGSRCSPTTSRTTPGTSRGSSRERTRPFKTSIVFAHDREGTSVLFKVLSAFAFRDISLTKIESRPHRHRHPIQFVDGANVGTAKHFEYMFYIDFQASMAEVRAVGDTGVHLLPPRARQLPHGHDAMGLCPSSSFAITSWKLRTVPTTMAIQGQIPFVLRLAFVFRSVSKSLERLGAAPPTKSFWTRNYLLKLQNSLDIAWQSLSLMERTFHRLESKQVDKVASLAAVAAAATDAANRDRLESKQVDEVSANKACVHSAVIIFLAVSNERAAYGALSAYRSSLEICRANMTVFNDMHISVNDKLLDVAGAGEKLQANIRIASGMTRILAIFLGPWIQRINGAEGIPPTMRIAFSFCSEHMWSIKTCADTPFLLLGCGAFSLRRRLKLSMAAMRCLQLQSSEASETLYDWDAWDALPSI